MTRSNAADAWRRLPPGVPEQCDDHGGLRPTRAGLRPGVPACWVSARRSAVHALAGGPAPAVAVVATPPRRHRGPVTVALVATDDGLQVSDEFGAWAKPTRVEDRNRYWTGY